MKFPSLLGISFCVLLAHPFHLFSQNVKDAGVPRKGKIRVNQQEVGVYDRQVGDYRRFHFRTFSVDSVQPEMFFGNHYSRLKLIVKQDPEASIYLINATQWEKTQRICIGATIVGLGAVILIPMDQKTFNTGMGINCVAAGGILVSYIFKRHWANKSIKTWNRHLDEGKYVYQ